jgi:hypothetical protein
MEAPVYINAVDFINQLKSKGLVIVSAKEFEAGKEITRRRLMRRKALSLAEIANNELLPVKTKKGVNDWILSGKIYPHETYIEEDGKKRVMVLTSAIIRLCYE